jgi:hypothetical protein
MKKTAQYKSKWSVMYVFYIVEYRPYILHMLPTSDHSAVMNEVKSTTNLKPSILGSN